MMDVPGARLYYRLDGAQSAPVVVLANSLGTALSMWDAQVPVLTRYFRVLRYDLRGHGASSLSEEPFGVERLAADVIALLDGLNLGRVHFCGLSLGGMVGLWLGAHAPHRLNRLVLCNTAAQIGSRAFWDARIDMVRMAGTVAIGLTVMGLWFTPAFREREPHAGERLWEMLLETGREGYIAACAAVRDSDLRSSAADVRVPTLVVAGEQDVATPPAEGRWLAERIPGARYLELPAAHLSNIEARTLFNQSVIEFLTQEERARWKSAND
jgi:3-oxoadipate enol-lactonase